MLKKFFSAGLLFWVPLLITVWILDSVIQLSDRLLVFLPDNWFPDYVYKIPGLGLVLAAAIILVTGIVVANVLGKKLVGWWEALLERIPVVNQIYGGVKKITGTFLNQQSQSFQKVVLVEFPRRGAWTLGFVVGRPEGEVSERLGPEEKLLTVFVPTAPNPTSGYVIVVPEDQTRETSVGVDEAFTFHVSMGVVTPGRKALSAPDDSVPVARGE